MTQCAMIIESTGLRCRNYVSQQLGDNHMYCRLHQWVSNLPPNQKKWCRCILHVAAKQPDTCFTGNRTGKGCYNVYAVCSKSVGTSSRKCGEHFQFENIPDKELIAYAKLKKIDIPKPYSRTVMIKRLHSFLGTYKTF